MSGRKIESQARVEKMSGVSLYCMASLVADEASRHGFAEFAKSVEASLTSLLSEFTPDQQRHALKLSYEMALGGCEEARPRLRLVYSRD